MIYVDSDNDEKYFKQLYLKYYDKIYNYIYHRVLNKEDAEDIISNVFFNIMDFVKKKNPKIENFNAWIYRIATNEIIQHLRKTKKRKHVSLDNEKFYDESTNIEQLKKSSDNDENLMLFKELDNLKDIEKTIVTLHFFENKKYSEISQILNININTLRPMMSRILKKLYKKLKYKI